MKKLILALLFLGVTINGYADTVDGYESVSTEVQEYDGISAPSVSPSGDARLYFDSSSNKLKVSENGGAYTNVAGDLTVKEQDGTPNVTGVSELRVTNGTLTDEGGGAVSISTGGGGGGGNSIYIEEDDTAKGNNASSDLTIDFQEGLDTSVSGQEIDVTVDLSEISGYNNTNWDTAYGWGDHSTQNYFDKDIDTSDDINEGSTNYFATDERIDDRVNALVVEGEGLDITYDDIANTLTFAGEDASDSNKGVAKFSLSDFTVSAGNVTIATDGVDDTEINWGTGGSQVSTDDMTEGSSNLYYTDARVKTKVQASEAYTIGGTWTFSNVVSGQTPTSSAHLTTKDYVDTAIAGLDWQESVDDFHDASGSLPSTPSTGDRYICSVAGNGWTLNYIYEYNGASWDETVATEGMAAWDEDSDVCYVFNDTDWVQFSGVDTHNNLTGLQGGTTNEYYHLTSAQYTDLTDSGDSTLHYHAEDRKRANHTGTQAASTISDFEETAEDVIANALVDSTTIDFSYVDAAGEITGAIKDNSIEEVKLKAVNSPTDEDIFTYEATTGDFEWETPSELGLYYSGGSDVAVADGGTYKSSWTQYAIPYLSGSTAFSEIPIGTAGKVLTVNGTATGYEWTTSSASTQEEIDDWVDALINDGDSTHTRITITYDDTDNAMDFVVDDDLANYDNTNSAFLTSESQNIFNTIAVSGQSNVEADSTTDTLTIAAGTDISIVTAPLTDTITINSTAGTQNLWETISSDSGSTTADADDDTLTVSGAGIVTTAISGDILTITGTEVDGSTTNELNIFTTDDSEATEGTAITLSGAGIVTTSESSDTITITGTEADTLDSVCGRNATTDDAITTAGLTVTTTNHITVGAVQWDDGSDAIDGEKIANDTIDDDSIDFNDVNADDLSDGVTNAIVTLTQESNWDTAYGWGDHSSQNYLDDDTADDVDDADIDWGSEAGQVNSDDVPEGSTNLYQDSELTQWIDDVTLGSSGALTLPSGQNFVIGTTQWNSSDEIDGTKIKDADYGDVTINAEGAWDVENAQTITVADTTDTTAYIAIWESATGDLAPKSDAGITYNAGTGTLTATAFSGPLTGNVTGTASNATLASTLTITDNEDTNENNAVIFTSGGDLDGGDLGLESDGDFHYNPSTGTVTATIFAGALSGNATTCTTASAGDAASDFFGAGVHAVTDGTACTDIEGTNLSITTGTLNWSATESDIETITGALFGTSKAVTSGYIWVADGTDFESVAMSSHASIASGGAVTVTDWDAGADTDMGDFDMKSIDGLYGVDDLIYIDMGNDGYLDLEADTAVRITAPIQTDEFPAVGTDPDVNAAGEIGRDSDNHSLRGYDGSAQYLYAEKQKTISFTITKPLDLDEDADLIVWTNRSAFSFVVTAVYSVSDTDNTDYDLDECDYHDNTTNRATITDPAIDTNGTGFYYDEVTGLTHTIDSTHHIVFDADGTDDPNFIQVTIVGYYNSDVD